MFSTLRSASFTRRAVTKIVSRGLAKEIKFGVDGRQAMLRGVDTLADAVQVRLLITEHQSFFHRTVAG